MNAINLLYRSVNAKAYSWSTSDGLRDSMSRNGLLEYFFDVHKREDEMDFERMRQLPILLMRGYEPRYQSIVDKMWGKQFMACIETETTENMVEGFQPLHGFAREYSRKFDIVFVPSSKDVREYWGRPTMQYKFMVDTQLFNNWREPITDVLGYVGTIQEREQFLGSIPGLEMSESPRYDTAFETAYRLVENMGKYMFLLAPAGRSIRIMSGRVSEIMACERVCFAFCNETIRAEQDMSYLKDGENIVLWETIDELMDKYKFYKENKEKANLIAKAGRKTALEHHSIDMWVKRFVQKIWEMKK